MSREPRRPEPRAPQLEPRAPLRVAIDIRLVIARHADGRWEVGCRDTAGKQHNGFAATWRAACEIAAHCASEIAAELSEAGRVLPMVSDVIPPRR